jgi:peptidyl-dipeptidase Dcp
MDWHTLKETAEQDPVAFEKKSLSRIGLIPEIVVRYRTPYFRHIFAGGYSSGYYSYDWSAVLDSDAFEAFKETSLFDQDKAQALRKYIFSAGNTDEPMTMFKNFRGREPRPEPLLRKRGFLK